MTYNFNLLEELANNLLKQNNVEDALKIFYAMADGDPSLDAGYLGMRIGECYEKLNKLHAAKYWYGRAVEENPTIELYKQARERLDNVNVDELIKR